MVHRKFIVHPAAIVSAIARLRTGVAVKRDELLLINIFSDHNSWTMFDVRHVRAGREFAGGGKGERGKRRTGHPQRSQGGTTVGEQAVLPRAHVFSRVPAPIRNCVSWTRMDFRPECASQQRQSGTVAAGREPKLDVILVTKLNWMLGKKRGDVVTLRNASTIGRTLLKRPYQNMT